MPSTEEKQSCLRNLADQGVVMVHLDARRPGVRVPDYLKTQEWLRLNFNHVKGRADLVVNDWGVRETLRFNGSWFPVSVPWSAIFAVSLPDQDTQPTIFAEDLPEEMVEAALARLQSEGEQLDGKDDPAPPKAIRRERRVPQTRRRASPPPEPMAEPAPPPPGDTADDPAHREIRRGHLRLVK